MGGAECQPGDGADPEMTRVMRSGAWALVLVCTAASAQAAPFVIQVSDGAGEGFNDSSPPDAASAAGGNSGSTLGEQRLVAFEYAAEQWASRLDSSVTIVVQASMDALECGGGGAVLGSAGPATFFYDDASRRWYSSALANALAGADLTPDAAEIVAFFNTTVDTNGCLGSSRWYYGLDGEPPAGDVDFLSVVLHELAHGLGATSLMDYGTGQYLGNNDDPDSYSALVFDLERGSRWSELNAAQRAASVTNVRNLVWDGAAVTAAAGSVLAPGAPTVVTDPAVPGFSGAINETDFGPTALQMSASGELVEVANSCAVPTDLDGKVVLLRLGSCLGVDEVETAGAVGVLLDAGSSWSPPGDFNLGLDLDLEIPTLHVSSKDANALANALSTQTITVGISASSARVGADASGRLLLNATVPVSEGSSIAHWDSFTRRTQNLDTTNRDLLMEPAGLVNGLQLDLTVELLLDIGWGGSVCGDGSVDGSEQCDDGEDNSNSEPGACRTNCQLPRCGDGVQDSAEECDAGEGNGTPASPCRPDCTVADCGNGALDPGEDCDDGNGNSDTQPNACRLDCTSSRCGDGVIDSGEVCDDRDENGSASSGCLEDCSIGACGDGVSSSGEECDDGEDNSDTEPNACRSTCRAARCGDGVLDSSESCDDGAGNSNATPDACRTDCGPPFCGDSVVDSGESCDDGALNGTTLSPCPTNCVLAGNCGNGVVEAGEECDEGADNSDTNADACRGDCTLARCGDGVVDSDEACDDGNDQADDGCNAQCQGPMLENPGSSSEPMGPGAGDAGSAGGATTPSTPSSGEATPTTPAGTGNGVGDGPPGPTPSDSEATTDEDGSSTGAATTDDTADTAEHSDTTEHDDVGDPVVSDGANPADSDAGTPASGAPSESSAGSDVNAGADGLGCGCTLPGNSTTAPHWSWSLGLLLLAGRRRKSA